MGIKSPHTSMLFAQKYHDFKRYLIGTLSILKQKYVKGIREGGVRLGYWTSLKSGACININF